MEMDNHHDDYVAAWLGDLGRDLPHQEQLHWKSHNIAPCGGISAVFSRRQLLAEFADSDRAEHQFKHRYRKLAEDSPKKLGWPLFLPLSEQDSHYFDSLRVPTKEEQKDFDEVVLALTKLLVDSLNEKELRSLIPEAQGGETVEGISRLEIVLVSRNVEGSKEQIAFLRSLQNLRSSGTAHRKGKKYRKVAAQFEIDSRSLLVVFEGILQRGVEFLEFLDTAVRDGVSNKQAKSANSSA
jgi:hypothetical protein